MAKYVVILDLEVNEEEIDPPCAWLWDELLNVEYHDNVRIKDIIIKEVK